MHELTTTPVDFVCWTVALLLGHQAADQRRSALVAGRRRAARASAWTPSGTSASWSAALLPRLRGARRPPGRCCAAATWPAARSLFAVLAAPDFVWQALHGWPNFAVFGHAAAAGVAEPGACTGRPGPLHEHRAGAAVGRRRAWALRSTRGCAGRDRRGDRDLRAVRAGRQGVLPGRHLHVLLRRAARRRVSTGTAGCGRRRVAVYCVAAAVSAVISLPVLPAAALARFPVQKINYDLGEEIGWPSQVELLASVWTRCPPPSGAATLLAGNYGEAGAVDRYGAAFGLPRPTAAPTTSGCGGRRPPRDTVGGRDQRGPGPAAPLVQLVTGGGRVPQRPRRVRRRGGRGGLRRHRPALVLGDGLACVPRLLVVPAAVRSR